MGKSKIDYLDWAINFVTGCTQISDGCKNCYAKGYYERFDKSGLPFNNVRVDMPLFYKRLNEIDGKKSMIIGINFMADTFHEKVTDNQLEDIINHLEGYPEHQFIIFTKRFKRVIEFLDDRKVSENVHFGVSICDGEDLNEFLYMDVVTTNFNHKLIVSFEPLLGELSIFKLPLLLSIAKWIIVGAESLGNRGGRKYMEHWVESIKTICRDSNVPFYHKQQFINGKKTHLLDGKEYLEFPKQLKKGVDNNET